MGGMSLAGRSLNAKTGLVHCNKPETYTFVAPKLPSVDFLSNDNH